VSELLDVLALTGSGNQARMMERASVREAEMVIAVMAYDEVNLTSSLLAHTERAKKNIIRVNDPDFLDADGSFSAKDFGIDLVIYPEGLAA
jgi:trk system potassium uptake protein TrkA